MKLMKKITVFAMAFCTMLLVACSLNSKSPSNTVKKYLECLKSGQYEKAIGYFDLEDQSDETELKMLAEKMGKSIQEKGGLKSYELVKDGETISEDGNSASVAVKITFGDETKENTFKLNKVNKEWKIDLLSK
jgi:hypothetical protein